MNIQIVINHQAFQGSISEINAPAAGGIYHSLDLTIVAAAALGDAVKARIHQVAQNVFNLLANPLERVDCFELAAVGGRRYHFEIKGSVNELMSFRELLGLIVIAEAGAQQPADDAGAGPGDVAAAFNQMQI